MDLRTLLKKEHLRQLRIIEYLYFYNNPANGQALRDYLQISERKLFEDIKQINQEFSKLTLRFQKDHLLMEATEDFGIDTVYSHLLENTPEMHLVELLFWEECLTPAEIAEQLYVSVASAYRLCHRVKDFFAAEGLTVESRPMRIEGDERAIRLLYLQFFAEKNNEAFPLFTDLYETKWQRILTDFAQEITFENYHLKELLDLSGRIALIRQQHQHFLTLERPAKQSYLSLERKKDLQLVQKQLGLLQIKEAEIFWLVHENLMLLSVAQFNQARQSDPVIRHLFTSFKQVLAHLDDQLGLTTSPEEKCRFAFHLLNENYYFRSTNYCFTILSNPRKVFLTRQRSNYPAAFEKLVGLVKHSWPTGETVEGSIKFQQFLFHLLLFFPQLLLTLTQPLKILLISHITSAHALFLQDRLAKKLEGNLAFRRISEVTEEQDLISDLPKYDLIISTNEHQPYLADFPVMTVKPIPDFSDLAKIQRKIIQLNQGK